MATSPTVVENADAKTAIMLGTRLDGMQERVCENAGITFTAVPISLQTELLRGHDHHVRQVFAVQVPFGARV